MKKIFILLLLIISLKPCCAGNPEKIRTFYVSYMNNLLNRISENKELCQRYLTKGLIEKNGRVVSATNSNPIIQLQDINNDAIETLNVEELNNDWYIVKYQWKKGDVSSEKRIPLKAYEIDEEFRIVYISPSWNGGQYGDFLIAERHQSYNINNSSELLFLKSFYNAYLSEYGIIETDAAGRLSKLRDEYLTKNAKADFEKAEQKELLDNKEDFYLLIDNFDFEYLWAKSLVIEQLNYNNFLVSFDCNGRTKKIIISLSKNNNGYMIDRIQRYKKT